MFVWYWNIDGKCVFFDFDPSEFLTTTFGSLFMIPVIGWDCD